ncbi:MAG: MBL fold metallo-hydrolase [Candidatus Micrarchaeota archaeon]
MYLNLPEGKIALDTSDKSADLNFISHAHADHIRGAKKNAYVIASNETHNLIKVRNGIELNIKPIPNNFKLLDAGHILGSKQLFIESSLGYSILYTGDYQLQESCVAKKIEAKEADILIIDSTYPYLNVKFDERSEVEDAIKKYVLMKLEKGIVLLGAYALGKAQELIKILNSAGIIPVVDKKISGINKVYSNFGISLEYASIYDDEEAFNNIVKHNFVGVVSLKDLRELAEKMSIAYSKKVFTGVATGFAKLFRFNTDVQFPLSDHADIYQAANYIDLVGAKVVYTYGSNPKLMASNLKRLGYEAMPFSEAKELAVEIAQAH